MVHHYLQTASRTMQSRLRKRGRQGKYSYIHTIRKQVMIIKHSFVLFFSPTNPPFSQMGGQVIEVKTPLTHRDYSHLVDQEVEKKLSTITIVIITIVIIIIVVITITIVIIIIAMTRR